MQRIDASTYRALLASATVLERDRHGEKVLALADGTLVKIFRRKRLLSTALLFPYARRFVRNAAKLARLGIATVTVVDLQYCAAGQRHLVTYHPLPGETLRAALRDASGRSSRLLDELAGFVAQIHEKGVYFRSLHFGNIIVPPDASALGLIDVADLAVRARALSVAERLRNFRHMLRYAEDVAALRAFGWPGFVDRYLAATRLPADACGALRRALLRLPEFSGENTSG